MAISMTASAAPCSDRAVVFACDGAYLPFAAMAADQIARLNPERAFDICICSLGERLALPQSLASIGVRSCGIETGGVFSGLGLDARRTEAMYLRLALPLAFVGQYRRLWYFDSDVFVQGGDFAAMLHQDLGGRAVAAVRDNLQWRAPGRRPEEFRRMGLPLAPYLNSGALLIDVAAYCEGLVLERCLELGAAHPEALTRHDQSLLNLVLHRDWAELSPVWNWQYTRASQLTEALVGAHVVHFIGAKKPWKHRGGELPLRFRRDYRTFLATHFPSAAPGDQDGPSPVANRAYLRRMLMRHLSSVGRMADYLDRFKSDLTVLT